MDAQFESNKTKLILELVQSGDEITLGSYSEYILGRTNIDAFQDINDTKSNDQIDIDLSPYQSYEAGVSRRHASLYFGQEKVTIKDLGSTNGTRLNGEGIQAFTSQDLHSGDVITLGKFKIKILIQNRLDNSTVEGGKL